MDPQQTADRLQRLEESQGFAERTIEQLHGEVAALNRQLGQAGERLRRLEARLDQFMRAAEPEDEGG
jgi:uncharacterized coiled-coil protein SlyX